MVRGQFSAVRTNRTYVRLYCGRVCKVVGDHFFLKQTQMCQFPSVKDCSKFFCMVLGKKCFEVFCYCKSSFEKRNMIMCPMCKRMFHQECIDSPMAFVCKNCVYTLKYAYIYSYTFTSTLIVLRERRKWLRYATG